MRTRFEPSDLNSILDLFKDKYRCQENHISIDSGEHGFIIPEHSYFKWQCLQNKCDFVVFKMAKDAQNKTNEPYLPYVGELIEKYKNKYPESTETLLIPMRQCRGYAKTPATLWSVAPILQCQHVVLIEVDLAAKHIRLHNSQTGGYTYPDKLVKIAGELDFQYSPFFYGVQKDPHSCGYYLWAYMRRILKTGAATSLKNISLEDARYETKAEFKDRWDEVGDHDMTSSALLTFEVEEAAATVSKRM